MPDKTIILHIDDREENRYVIQRILKDSFFEVVSAADGAEGYAAAIRHMPTLIVLDVNLPDISGIELCRRFKANPVLCEIPVLHVSGHFTSTEWRVEGLESGADAYLAAPIDPAELKATVKALLRVHEAESKARGVAKEWQVTFDSVRDPILLFDCDGKLMRCNLAATRVFRQEFSSLIGESWSALMQEIPLPVPRIEDMCAETPPEPAIAEITRYESIFRVTVDPVSSLNGPVGFVCVMVDVTQECSAEREIRRINNELTDARDREVRANRVKSSFLASMSHELRTPLNVILGYAEILQEDAEDRKDAELIRDVQRIREAGHHLLELVTDILDLSKIEAGRLNLSYDSIDVQDMLQELAETIRPLLRAGNNTLDVHIQPDVGIIWTDVVKLRQILLNVLSNACKFTANGHIDIRALREIVEMRDYITIEVEDSGIGIAPEKLPDAFKEYEQLGTEDKRGFRGTGLGLAISKHLSRMIGATISASSELGVGSTFTVRVPASAGK